MAKQHFVTLAHTFDPNKHGVGGWFASEKLDGQRCVYIPGTRGLPKANVPWANHDKDERYLEEQICSGLFSRYGNVIQAPDFWLDDLPETFLDGELWLRRGTGGRQELSKIIRKIVPDDDAWDDVQFHCFDMPSPEAIFADRIVSLTNYHKDFAGALAWWEGLGCKLDYRPKPTTPFRSTNTLLKRLLSVTRYAHAHTQHQLDHSTETALVEVEGMVEGIEEMGGEGLVIRHPDKSYVTERAHHLLKVKGMNDDEATVVGYVTGRATDKGSKLLGMMGALVLDYNGLRFELSGFTEAERSLGYTAGVLSTGSVLTPTQWAEANPASHLPDCYEATEFPRGSAITFRYRDKTSNGMPNEARYWRRQEKE